MKTLTNIVDRIPLDNKLLASFTALAVTRVALGVLLGESADRRLTIGIPFVVGAVVGYQTHNDGSILRRAATEDGNPALPHYEAVPEEAVPEAALA